MKTTRSLASPWSTPALVDELDDLTLMSGHALLNGTRAEEFRRWIDVQLSELERQFEAFRRPQPRCPSRCR
ncbi:MAG: hypothetical protein MUF48_00925 [Pirellulaceae bacterium]|jgi:hypothetical protein|nr:hypothetical protein [Pirellulaceae bacterium]